MAIETKDQYFERVMSLEKPLCPHCHTEMSLWETPPINFSDGLGWGSPYLFVCFNDECTLYQEGWNNIEENYGHTASYRCMKYPDSDGFECMPVFSPQGARGQVIDDQAMLEQEILKENTMKGFSILADCYVQKDGVTALRMLLDPSEPVKVRLKAAEMIGDIGLVEAIDPLRDHKFGNPKIQEQADQSIRKIHHRFGTIECPACAEIIKQRATVCRYCGQKM